MSVVRLAALCFAVVHSVQTLAAQQVWWEAEAAAATNFPKQTWLSGRNLGDKQQLLSGGEWLSTAGPRGAAPLTASYRVDVPAAGDYALWVRKFYKHGPFSWRFDEAGERQCTADCALADNVALITHVCANWVDLGRVELTKGPHTLTVTLAAGEGAETTAAFDCFLLTAVPFVPDGKRKPGDAEERVDAGMFAFAPPPDPFAAEALLDLRFLNERTAGEHGPVRAVGAGFVRGDGAPMRWVGVNAGPEVWLQSHATIDYLTRKLAKLGVNLLRIHGRVAADADPRQVDAGKLDAICYLVAACKREGIYTTLSSFFPLWFRIDGSWGIDDYDGAANKHPFAAIFFDERLQAIQRGWWRQVLTTVNPYTKVALAKEPALAAIELVNEDSLFFWTFSEQNVPPALWQKLQRQFGKDLVPAWNMTRDGMAKSSARARQTAREQVRFLAGLQRGYYAQGAKFLRGDLGYGGLVIASNWHVSDPAQLDAVERWTYEPADVVDAHGYFAAPHQGPRAGWALDEGDTFGDVAFVDAPDKLPLQFVQTVGKPQIVSEIGWPAPNRRRGDGVLVATAYAAANGIDGLFWFAIDSAWLRDTGISKFGFGTPDQIWTLPLAALMYRRGDLEEGQPVLAAKLPDDTLFALGGSAGGAAQLDPVRSGSGPGTKGLDVHTFLSGPVVRSFGAAAPRTVPLPASKGGVTRHVAGQLALDERRGVFTIDAPRCQAVSGRLGKAGEVKLTDCAIAVANEFAAIGVISLDGEPLRDSKRMLIQAMTAAVPFGFREQGGRIVKLGGAPAQVQRVDGAVAFGGAALRRVTALDGAGMPRSDAVTLSGNTVRLSPDAIWYVVER
ncbi:MAG: hypothetical protein KDC48_00350 [Planctomycetes bacterium]|nr:hypothetical protein [Planctomycetota bacterium]